MKAKRCACLEGGPEARARAEAPLRRKEEQYRLLFEANPCPMWICDENTFKFLDVNQAALRLYGWSRREFLEMTAKDIRPPEDLPRFVGSIRAERKGRVKFIGEWRHVKRDGTVFEVAVSISPISFAGHEARLVLVNEITERKAAEAALQKSEQRYRSLFENDLTGDFIATPDGTIVLCNPTFAAIFGFGTPEAAIGSNLESLQANAKAWPALVKLLKQHERVIRHECLARRRDGAVLQIVETVMGTFNERGKLVQIQGYVFDDTERKRAEALLQQLNATLEQRVCERTEELSDANERLQAMMGTALIGIMTLDERGIIKSLNPAAAQIFGYAPNELVGRGVSRLLEGPGQAPGESFLGHYQAAGEQRTPGFRGEVLGRSKEGRRIVLESSAVEFSDGGRRQVIVMVRDITKRKRLERELLAAGERERQRLGHDLHDGLGQHLHALFYMATLLEMELKGDWPERAQEAGRLARQLEHGLELVRSLARGLQPVNPVPEGLMAALRELTERTRALYRVDSRFQCPVPVLIHRHSAANDLYRIAQEAVNNAMKHGKPTRLRVKLMATSKRITLGIRDDGRGIGRPSARAQGMGLQVMQYRAEAIGGSLTVQRHPQGGTEVVCTVARQALLPQEENIE